MEYSVLRFAQASLNLMIGHSIAFDNIAGFDKEMGTCWDCNWGGSTTSLVPPVILELASSPRYR